MVFRLRFVLPLVLCAGLAACGPAGAAAGDAKSAAGDAAKSVVKRTGLPLPRFASLRSDEANLRTGPGPQYPVEWVFVRKELPVEITEEFDTWRRIRDWEGSAGWVHQSMLSGRRSVVVTGAVRDLRSSPNDGAAVVARAEPNVIGDLKHCEGAWCLVELAGHRGWLKRSEIWGVYPAEKVD